MGLVDSSDGIRNGPLIWWCKLYCDGRKEGGRRRCVGKIGGCRFRIDGVVASLPPPVTGIIWANPASSNGQQDSGGRGTHFSNVAFRHHSHLLLSTCQIDRGISIRNPIVEPFAKSPIAKPQSQNPLLIGHECGCR
ncbi:unnamed protein product [Linum trigynum]|uniref:Uncharacterized protein n=1 Tax=Linum trigynum TaxID=586398 RepID=A0AAV2FZW0_9ROSI